MPINTLFQSIQCWDKEKVFFSFAFAQCLNSQERLLDVNRSKMPGHVWSRTVLVLHRGSESPGELVKMQISGLQTLELLIQV